VCCGYPCERAEQIIDISEDGQSNLFHANALPEPDLRYFLKRKARLFRQLADTAGEVDSIRRSPHNKFTNYYNKKEARLRS
jgi:hypothetical protein